MEILDGYIKYFDDGGKNMSFVTDDEKIYEKYNEIWEVIRNLLKVDFTVGPVRDDIYLVAKLKIFNKINRTTFNNNNAIPIERNHYICVPAIEIDSVIKIDKRVYPQAYLEQCNYKLKKVKRVNFIDDEIIDDDDDDDDDDDGDGDTDDSYDSDNKNENDFISIIIKMRQKILLQLKNFKQFFVFDKHKNNIVVLLTLGKSIFA